MEKIIKNIKKHIGDFKPEIALVLGSGLASACPDIKVYKEITYDEIGFPKGIVKGHNNKFVFGEYKGIKLVLFSRFHYYESGDLNKVNIPFEVISKIGVKDIILATATGGAGKDIKAGDLVLVKDHINLAPNPLIARKDQYFVDMSDAYNAKYRVKIKEIALSEKINLVEGIHAQVTGPSYETQAEGKMLQIMGAHTVSMSTAQDVILSRFYGMNVLCFAAVCNTAGSSMTHEEVLNMSKHIAEKLKVLLSKFLETLK